MRVHGYCSQPHYAWYITPILEALPDEHRGQMYRAHQVNGNGPIGPPPPGEPCIVAGWIDYSDIADGERRIALVEHGAGQTYSMRSPSNPGGTEREGIHLYLDPNETVSAINLAAYPRAKSVVVGSPWLDRFVGRPIQQRPGSVALTWHHPCPSAVPESKWAYPYYEHFLPRLTAVWEVIASAHPRIFNRLEPVYRTMGFEPVPNFGSLLGADVLLCDNSSAIPSWAAVTGKPVVFLNQPAYRRHVRHGGRFWDWVGDQVQVGHPADLCDAVNVALIDPPAARVSRQDMVDATFGVLDGKAAHRAAQAVLDHLI